MKANTPPTAYKMYLNEACNCCLLSVKNIFCNASTASKGNSSWGITNAIVGALNLLYNGKKLNRNWLKSKRYLPAAISTANKQAANIHHLCRLSTTTIPIIK